MAVFAGDFVAPSGLGAETIDETDAKHPYPDNFDAKTDICNEIAQRGSAKEAS
jgi:hypothetical protein